MADLSHAAQAVLDAYDLASDGNYINGEWIQDHAGQLAAALRAAADQQCRPSDWKPPFSSDEVDAAEWWEAGYEAAVEEIKARFCLIAAELEGATRDPLEPNDLSHLSDEEFQALAPQGFHGV